MDIQNTERDIILLENLDSSSNPVSLDHRCLRSLNNRHSALLKQNNIRWAQRALMLWLNKGDLNSKFFHNMGRVRSHRNKISEIKDTLGNPFCDQASIENCFEFFSRPLEP